MEGTWKFAVWDAQSSLWTTAMVRQGEAAGDWERIAKNSFMK
jgi:hypothetical protein